MSFNSKHFLPLGQQSDSSSSDNTSTASKIMALLDNQDVTGILILTEIPDEGIEVTEIEKRIPLTYSCLSSRLLKLFEEGLLTRNKQQIGDNPRSQPYFYYLAPDVTPELIKAEIDKRRLNVEKIKRNLAAKQSRLSHLKKYGLYSESSYADEINQAEAQNQTEEYVWQDDLECELQQADSEEASSQEATSATCNNPDQETEVEVSSSPPVASEPRTLLVYEILQTIEEMAVKIAQQDERIAELEKQLSIFPSAQVMKDPKELLRNVRSKLNLGSTSIHNGNAKVIS